MRRDGFHRFLGSCPFPDWLLVNQQGAMEFAMRVSVKTLSEKCRSQSVTTITFQNDVGRESFMKTVFLGYFRGES